MADKKTRVQKIQAENRKLTQENDRLRTEIEALNKKLAEISKCEEKRSVNSIVMKNIFLYVYEVMVSAIILVFVYWISINGYESFDIPYILFLILVILISVKCVINNKAFHIKPIFYVILNDLVKPAASMFIGLLLCIFCLGDAWKGAKGYALDVGYTVILVGATTIVVMIIVVVSYLVIGIKSLIVKGKDNKR